MKEHDNWKAGDVVSTGSNVMLLFQDRGVLKNLVLDMTHIFVGHTDGKELITWLNQSGVKLFNLQDMLIKTEVVKIRGY